MDNKSKLTVNLSVWAAAVALGAGLGWVASPDAQAMLEAERSGAVNFSAEYVDVDETGLMAAADVVFVGRVRHISDTRWNQDDAQPWQSDDDGLGTTALPLHELEIAVESKLVDTLPPRKDRGRVRVTEGQSTVLTVLGNSPWTLHDHAHHDLMPGDRAILFARYADLAWRENGTKPVLQLVGVPSKAHYIEEGQGLFYSRRDPERPMTVDALRKGLMQVRGELVR